MIETHVPPTAVSRLHENAAGRERRPDDCTSAPWLTCSSLPAPNAIVIGVVTARSCAPWLPPTNVTGHFIEGTFATQRRSSAYGRLNPNPW